MVLLFAVLGAVGAASAAEYACEEDWLLAADDSAARAVVTASEGGAGGSAEMQSLQGAAADATITLSNGLLERSFTTSPSFGTIDLKNLKTGDSILRHIVPEAALSIDGVNYTLGGLYIADVPSSTGAKFTGQHAFLNRTGLAARLKVQPNAWRYHSHTIGTPQADLPWVPGRRASPKYISWPPSGAISLDFPSISPPFCLHYAPILLHLIRLYSRSSRRCSQGNDCR